MLILIYMMSRFTKQVPDLNFGQGMQIMGKTFSINTNLSSCQPVIFDSKLTEKFYVYQNFFKLDIFS